MDERGLEAVDDARSVRCSFESFEILMESLRQLTWCGGVSNFITTVDRMLFQDSSRLDSEVQRSLRYDIE